MGINRAYNDSVEERIIIRILSIKAAAPSPALTKLHLYHLSKLFFAFQQNEKLDRYRSMFLDFFMRLT